ncbi:hypothetical protein [Streptococcus cuniculi]|uniref:Uncharacterized protein n=1 Tax=Streptococcus cuniculi TaxID=1432788 RepID=A0A4Y9JAK2_9STRE|nr:hypothetical protein [Streptococcus cuniculi]MBF0778346.1 hypothetical protein [Streptococcus cuniculi]TFU97837.1 hypothetical protein E4T82_06340 [Streptococcus cuniculi]
MVEPNKKKLAKHADRVLKNYRNFQKLANLSGAFAQCAESLVQEIDDIVARLDDVSRAILVNWYCQKIGQRKTRGQMCRTLDITVAEYQNIKNQGLLDFAKQYRNGVLETLPD